MSSFCFSLWSENSTSSRVSSYGSCCPAPKGGNFLRYSNISFIWKMKSWIFLSRGLYNPLLRYLFLCWSDFGGKKWQMKSFITNSLFAFVTIPLSWYFCSITYSASPITRFLVIPNLWGPLDRSWPRILFLRMVTNLRRDSWLPVRNSST